MAYWRFALRYTALRQTQDGTQGTVEGLAL